MKYTLNLVITFLVFASFAHGLTLNEQSIESTGFSAISITVPNQTQCETFTFIPFEGFETNGNDTVLSFPIDLLPLNEADANVSVLVNEQIQPLIVLHPTDIHPDSKMVHIIIPPAHQTQPETMIEICATASPSTDKLEIAEGTIGLYQQPRFDEVGSFSTYVLGENPVLGEEIPIQVYLHNDGGESVLVSVDYRKYELEYVPLLKGETGFQDVIAPGESKTITYKIKPLRAVSILLPPAVLTYENIFGEQIVQESSRAFLEVKAPEFNVKGAFLVPQNQVRVNEPTRVRWVVQNEGITPLYDIYAQFWVQPNGVISPTSTTIDTLTPSDATSQSFTLTFSEPGTYTVGCTLSLGTGSAIRTDCQSAIIEVVADTTGITLLFSLLLLLIAVGVYAYIYVLPQSPPKHESPPRKRFQHG